MNAFSTSWQMFAHWVDQHWFAIAFILVAAFLALRFGTMLIDKVIRRAVRNPHFNHALTTPEDIKKRQDTLASMLMALWRVGVWTVAILTLFKELAPFDTTALFASAGIVGIAIGFGAQSIIKDLLTGIFIIIENQYRVGDVVDLDGAAGSVEKITIRSTILRDADGNVHYMPNGNVAHVINKTMGFSRVNFTLTVVPATNVDDLAKIINTVGDAMKADEKWAQKIIDPPHFLTIGAFSDVSLEVKITGSTQPSQQWSVTGEMRKRLLSAFKKHKIELAHLPTASFSPTAKPAK